MAADRIRGFPFATRSEVLATRGMVASSQPLATQAGLDILKKGGSAVDAALAVNACLGLMEPTGCGIGGDLFAIGWDAGSKKLYGLNASGPSARGLDLGTFTSHLQGLGHTAIPTLGPLSITIPGCIDGWRLLHERYGRLNMAEVLAPGVEYALEGVPVPEVIAHHWQESVARRMVYPGFAETFTVEGSRGPRQGEVWRNPALAGTLSGLLADGLRDFYEGSMARTMASFLEEVGSPLRLSDFSAYRAQWVDPVAVSFNDHEVWELPPNGQGAAALQMLNIIKGFDLSSWDPAAADTLHLLIEAKKRAYADRALLYADPDFAQVPLESLLSEERASLHREAISPLQAARSILPDPPVLGKGDTVYLCVADGEGNMVSLIQSNFHGMGSGVCPPGLGFGFQNRGTAFALDPSHANAYAPGKRPFHTIIPGFLTRKGVPVCAFGVMGGDMQPQAHVQVLLNLLQFGMNLQEAGDAPRWYHSGDSDPNGYRMVDGGQVALEHGFPEETIRELIHLGHRVVHANGVFGGYQAIWRDPETGVLAGASESRKDGQAAGF